MFLALAQNKGKELFLRNQSCASGCFSIFDQKNPLFLDQIQKNVVDGMVPMVP